MTTWDCEGNWDMLINLIVVIISKCIHMNKSSCCTIYIYVCVCIYIYIYTHTHTHTYNISQLFHNKAGWRKKRKGLRGQKNLIVENRRKWIYKLTVEIWILFSTYEAVHIRKPFFTLKWKWDHLYNYCMGSIIITFPPPFQFLML